MRVPTWVLKITHWFMELRLRRSAYYKELEQRQKGEPDELDTIFITIGIVSITLYFLSAFLQNGG